MAWLRVIAFAALAAAGTILTGWWIVPILAAGWVRVLPRHRRGARTVALGAALGWGAILTWSVSQGPVAGMAVRLSSVLGLPSWGFTAATLLFPALLAGTAARLFAPSPSR
jgi:hypothetical protein